jgi:crotonobetaine/carnitine-CoA ligase
VYGVPAASGAPGEVDLVAALVAAPGQEIEGESIFEAFISGLERNAVPSYIQVVDEIPKTISEKNLDRVLKERFREDAENVYKLEDFV